MARRRKNNGFSQPMISFEYFFDDDRALKIRTVQRRTSSPTNLRHNEGITLLFVRQGRGEVAVNTHRLPVERGTLMALYPPPALFRRIARYSLGDMPL